MCADTTLFSITQKAIQRKLSATLLSINRTSRTRYGQFIIQSRPAVDNEILNAVAQDVEKQIRRWGAYINYELVGVRSSIRASDEYAAIGSRRKTPVRQCLPVEA